MDLDIRNTPRVAGPPGPPQIEIKQAHSHPPLYGNRLGPVRRGFTDDGRQTDLFAEDF